MKTSRGPSPARQPLAQITTPTTGGRPRRISLTMSLDGLLTEVVTAPAKREEQTVKLTTSIELKEARRPPLVQIGTADARPMRRPRRIPLAMSLDSGLPLLQAY